MKKMNDLTTVPLDHSDDFRGYFQDTIYDNLPYVRDKQQNQEWGFSLESGNLIKGCRCQTIKTIEIKN